MKRVHQNIEIEGIDRGTSNRRKKSNFFNEGKWNNFIEPLLPKDCKDMTLIEIGCNAGMFLKLAKDKGFTNVIGIEKDKTNCDVGKEYRDSLGLDYKIINDKVGQKFDFDNLPVSDYVVLSNLHYHLLLDDFLYLEERLFYKTRYCLVVSVYIEQPNWRPKSDIESVRSYFKKWKEVDVINPITVEGDPRPRDLFGILFKSDLERKEMSSIRSSHLNMIKRSPSLEKLVDDVMKHREIDIRKHPYYDRTVRSRKHKWTEKQMYDFVRGKIELAIDVRDNGLKRAVNIEEDGRMLEGNHRLVILRHLGHSSVLVRII